jgi:Tol biopolymer transport system component
VAGGISAEHSPRKRDSFLTEFSGGPAPEPEEIRAQLEHIRNSEVFVRSARIQKLLEYLVESVLAGQQERLKESVIGFEVFERSPDYDPKVDPIVRVEMRRIRGKLSEYYLHEGQSDSILIWLEKGSYVPLLAGRAAPTPSFGVAVSLDCEPKALLVAAEPAVVIPPIEHQPAAVEQSPAKTHRVLFTRIASAALLVLIAGAAWLHFSRPTATPTRTLRLFPLTGNAGLEISPSFSPDGKQVAYSWDGNRRNLDIYIKPVEGGAPRRLTDNAAHDVHPAWSPDGQRIAFLRIYPEKSQVVVVPATGGVETVVREATPPVIRWHPDGPEGAGTNGPVWSADGASLITVGLSGQIQGNRIVKIYLDGRQENLTDPRGATTDSNPSLSPSGNALAYVRTSASNSTDLFVMPSRGGNPIRLTSDSRDTQGLTWLDEGHLLYSSNHGGSFRLWQVARTGGTPQLVPIGGAQPQLPAVSSDGHWLAFVDSAEEGNIWQVPLREGQVGAGQPFISSAGSDNSPAYSPDGRKIAFVSDRSGTRQIWLADSEGAEVRQLTNFTGSTVGTPRWAPDNRRIVFDASLDGQSAIWLIDEAGNNLHRLNSSQVREYLPSWSRDGKWVYYLSLHDGSDQLWKQRPDSGESVRITQDPFFDAVESPLGDFIYAQRPRGGIWQIPMRGGAPMPVPELNGVNPARYWTLVGGKLYFVRQEESPRQLESLDLKTRQIRKLTEIPGELLAGTPGLAVDPGSHSLLFVQKNQRRSSIILQER